MKSSVKGAYTDAGYGQIHSLVAGSSDTGAAAPLVCFQPTPFSGEYFRPFLEVMGADRLVFAPDTPGYGRSTAPENPPTIESLAEAMASWLDALGYGEKGKGKVDVIGFHTGDLVMAELAISRPDLIGRLVLVSVPYFDQEARARLHTQMTEDHPVGEDLKSLAGRWSFTVEKRADGVPLDRAVALFGEELESITRSWWGFHAAFLYAPEERFPKLTQPCLFVVLNDSLKSNTETAAEFVRGSEVVVLDDVAKGAFELKPERIAEAVREFCS